MLKTLHCKPYMFGDYYFEVMSSFQYLDFIVSKCLGHIFKYYLLLYIKHIQLTRTMKALRYEFSVYTVTCQQQLSSSSTPSSLLAPIITSTSSLAYMFCIVYDLHYNTGRPTLYVFVSPSPVCLHFNQNKCMCRGPW